ncbi:MAG: SPOR domain-containing protein [Nitrospirota bacterium]
MKEVNFKEKTPVLFISKWFILTSIIITSSLSFALGYLVGRNVRPAEQETAAFSQPVVQLPESQAQDSASVGQPVPETESHAVNENMQEIQKSEEAVKSSQTEVARQSVEVKSVAPGSDTKARSHDVKKYTVQVAAFKDFAEAEALKEKLQEKGYKAYVSQVATRKQETIYKVRIGEFAARKDADMLSAKLKKSEGLKSFVTFK